MSQSTKLNETLHPLRDFVKPQFLKSVKTDQVLYIVRLRREGCTFREIAKRLYAEFNTDITTQAIQLQYHKYKEVQL